MIDLLLWKRLHRNRRLKEANEYIKYKEYTHMNSTVGIMGIKNCNVHFVSMYISCEEIKIVEEIYKSDDDNGYCVIANGKTHLEKIFYEKLIQNAPCSIESIVRIFSEILNERANIDISINTMFDYEFIINDEKIKRNKEEFYKF